MPELPEVTTMVNGLKKRVLGRVIIDVWTDAEKLIKNLEFEKFKKQIKGKKIIDIFRKGKVICFQLSDNKILFVHPKMSGHFLAGKWDKVGDAWQSKNHKIDKYVHLMFWLDNSLMLAFSDLRKFVRIELWNKQKLSQAKIIQELGPDALGITLTQFEQILQKSRRRIKQILMDQKLIAGIGNIYADEILFQSRIYPFKAAGRLTKQEINKIYQAIKPILKKAIKLGGSSVSDFYNSEGNKGNFQNEFKVYRRNGKKCFNCLTIIKREKLANRSTHFCPKCQK